jgi:glycine/D-amino acid oxidase-like deaminating enzyme
VAAEVVICGAGIAGISTAYHLTVGRGLSDVVLVDERPPLSLTSDKSTECYRNWWPGPGDAMVGLMNRSIDILEALARAHANPFNLTRRGYLFASADPARIEEFRAQGQEAAALGAGPLREHRGAPDDPTYVPAPASGFEGQPTGADLITDATLIQQHFPYLSEATVAVLHARRAGWFSAQQLGMLMLDKARAAGLRFVTGRLDRVEQRKGRVEAVQIQTAEGLTRVALRHLVNAAGPYLKQVAALVGVELPVFSELHAKVAFNDRLGAFPRSAPLLIWTDPQRLPWTDDERQLIGRDPGSRHLLEEFPRGVHGRPDGPADSPIVLLLWTYQTDPVEPRFPLQFDPQHAEIGLRGMATMVPKLRDYFDAPPKPFIDGGYYTKTLENRPLVGPLPVEGCWVIGALSGYGLMASPACGELLAAHIAGDELPGYARWFLLDRYRDPDYQEMLANWGRSGQL